MLIMRSYEDPSPPYKPVRYGQPIINATTQSKIKLHRGKMIVGPKAILLVIRLI